MSEEKEKNGNQSEKKDRGQFPTLSRIDSVEEIGTQIGSYKVVSVLGEGGFGIVYLAEQKEPIRRQVALKVIKPGMDSKQVIGRFEAERQALALLDHPHIAHIFDGGTTESGRPYFVMELVKGLSITKCCDEQKLSIEGRLKLFGQVCDAVHHAHQKGIIHRDIKPSNILVSVEQDQPRPIIIDFGVAKAISQPLTERTLFTEEGQLIGTPEYMSPEQAELTTQDIDARSDIYSLGVLLYELLVGALPFDPRRLRRVAFDEILRIIRRENPPSPSRRVSTLGEESKKVAENRRTHVATLVRRLHGDLERIPLKAMCKSRDHRYQTAAELAQDVKNYLHEKPLLAGSGSITYRTLKFAQRHSEAVVAAILAALMMCMASSASMLWYLSFRQKKPDWNNKTKVAPKPEMTSDVLQATGNETPKINWPIPPLYPENLRDPMVRISDQQVVLGTSDILIVKGITYSEDRKFAIINDRTVREGDITNGATVLKISPNSVEFEKDGRKWTQEVQSEKK